MRRVITLIASGADINTRTSSGWTPLHIAAGFNHAVAIAILVRHGADVNTTDGDGDTPLMTAASLGHTDSVQQLLANGADPRATSAAVGHSKPPRHSLMRLQTGDTALHVAAECGNTDVASYLIAAWPSAAHVRNHRGQRPRDLVALAGDDDIILMLDENIAFKETQL